jgi:hypothetical protein
MDAEGRGREYEDWVLLAQDRDQWRILVNQVMILRAPYNAENFLISLAITKTKTKLRGF